MTAGVRHLDLALIGNGRIGLLVEPQGTIVWGCFPRFDGDPTFCALLDDAPPERARGVFAIELEELAAAEQQYVRNTAVLSTRLTDRHGGAVEIVDCVPRHREFDRMHTPHAVVRHVKRIAGRPRITVRLRPAAEWGALRPETTAGSHHIRYVSPRLTLRVTTDASLTAIADERPFFVEDTCTLVFGPDEPLPGSPLSFAQNAIDRTVAWWQEWVRGLAIPYEWQADVIRAAITLKLNADEDTGAIVAAMTSSIPESARAQRNWDYRYCWLRDGYFVVDALNRLGATATMEGYMRYLATIAANVGEGALQPVYSIAGDAALDERIVTSLPGYRGIGPVRAGNLAYRQAQHDAYGAAILAVTHAFFDERLARRGDASLFARLEPLGTRAIALHDQPDAGLWELRERSRVHTWSAVMCWAACDRLGRIAARLGLSDRAQHWRAEAQRVHRFVHARCWNEARGAYVAAVDGDALDASMLLLAELGFVRADDPRFAATVDAIGRELKRGDFVFRYVENDDFGAPDNAFVVCTFWYVNALAQLGRRDEARDIHGRLLACRTRHGLLAEHVDPVTREPWGNFVQTYSMVGLISAAKRLSVPWDEAF
ncbi:MAG TPA: glycoside hydrolase family 15 protein [Casimicrobiaceae bacterium]|nr:glycoside hydrolase family 15 protein [Casimicrobiaceae bacterium]